MLNQLSHDGTPLNLFLIDNDFDVVSKKCLPNLRSLKSSLMCSFRTVVVLGFTFRSMIHFGLIFELGENFPLFLFSFYSPFFFS